MKKNFLSVLFLCLVSVLAYAQDYPTGLVIDETADAAYQEIGVIAEDFGGKNDELPLRASLKKYCPPIKSQGRIGSCVGWATGYGAMSILHAQKYNWTEAEKEEKAFSALYIYNQIKVRSCPDGSRIDQAVHLLETAGNITSKEFDMPREDCGKQPTRRQKSAAQNFKIKTSSALFGLNADTKTKIYTTKKSLAKGVPVIIGMHILRNFGPLQGKKFWDPTVGNRAPAGGHAMVVIGYDEGKQAFEIMNSWGKNWGNKGFIWVKYNDYARYCKYGYQIFINENKKDEPKPDEPKPTDPVVSLTGSFYYQIPIFDETGESDNIKFEQTTVRKIDTYTYEMTRKDWEVGQMFQLVAQKLKKGSNVYVFSIDPDKEARLHFPRPKKKGAINSSDALFGVVERPLVPYSGQTIVIPNKETVLVKDKLGTDYIFILYSDKELTDIKQIITEIRTSSDMETALESALGNRLVPSNDVSYQNGTMQFSSKSSKGYVVPIILKQEGE